MAFASSMGPNEMLCNTGRVERCANGLSSDLILLLYAFLEFVLPILNGFNTTFQAGESMIGIMDAEMNRLLQKLLGRFVTTKVITAAGDITKVDFHKRDNQHGDELLAVGWRAREFIDANEMTPETTQKFFSSVRDFYMTLVTVMLAKFPFKDPTLKAMGYVNPQAKDKANSTEVQQLGARFMKDDREFLDQLEDEAQDYIVTPLSDLPSTENGLSQFWEDLGAMKLPAGTPRFGYLTALSRAVLSLPHSNADTERTFSVLRKIQQDSRGNLANKTVNALLSAKLNNFEPCFSFKPDKDLIQSAKNACRTYKS